MDGVDDVLERLVMVLLDLRRQNTDAMYPRKYRILDDCARLRDIIEVYKKESQPRFKPSLAIITWAEIDGLEAASDFGDMVRGYRILSCTPSNLNR